jgi:hypothetical protein
VSIEDFELDVGEIIAMNVANADEIASSRQIRRNIMLEDQKKEDGTLDEEARASTAKSTKSLKSVRSPTTETRCSPKQSRRVKFAEPIIKMRLYDRTASPNAETKPVQVPIVKPPTIDELQPPLSLVAQLDLAARKMNARAYGQQQRAHKATTSPQKQTTSPQPSTSQQPTSPQQQQQQTPRQTNIVSTNKIQPKDSSESSDDNTRQNVMRATKSIASVKSIVKQVASTTKNEPKKDKKGKS